MVNFYKSEQLTEQSTTSTTMVDISGTSVTFTPIASDHVWMIFASGVCRSSDVSEQSMEMRLVINDVEKDLWSHQNDNANTPNGAGFLIFDRITGTVSSQTIKLQFRAITGTCYAKDLRIIAAKVPNNADFKYYNSDSITSSTGTNLSVGSLTFTPSSNGNYFIIGSIKHREYPSGSTSQAWFEGSDASLHPDAPAGTRHSCARDSWNPATYIWRENLTNTSKTFHIRFTSSESGGESSEHCYRKLIAFREDAWDDISYNLAAAQTTTTSNTFQTKNSITTSTPPGNCDHLSIQCARISGSDTAGTSQKSGELRIDGNAVVRTDHHINRNGSSDQGYHYTIGVVDVTNTDQAITYDNGFLSPNSTAVECAESAIVVLRYAIRINKSHQMLL